MENTVKFILIHILLVSSSWGYPDLAEDLDASPTGKLEELWHAIPSLSNGIKIDVRKSRGLYKSCLIIYEDKEVVVFVPRLKIVDSKFKIEISNVILTPKEKQKCIELYKLAKSLKPDDFIEKSVPWGGHNYTLRIGDSPLPNSPFAKDTKNYFTWSSNDKVEPKRKKFIELLNSLPFEYFKKGSKKE